ncbi:MAG: effector protein, partial [SAR86 cluster bacterium]|nr:effector protein [SAR86 cluster bacterium]
MTLKNRMILAAMGSNFSTLDGHCSEKLIAYYEARARGGAAMLILETSAITWPAGASMPNTIGFSSDQFLPGLTELAARVHQHD